MRRSSSSHSSSGPGSRSRCGGRSGRAAPRAAGTCPRTRSGSAWRGRGTAARGGAWSPSIVTCRSCIASSSAACVFGGARLISSASRRFVKIGPGRKLEVASRWFQIDEPVTSEGIRSGVNWMRANRMPVTCANERAVSVLASPGTSSSRTWPSARSPSEDELQLVALADDRALDLVDDGSGACAASSLSSMRARSSAVDGARARLERGAAAPRGPRVARAVGADELPRVVAEHRACLRGIAVEVDAAAQEASRPRSARGERGGGGSGRRTPCPSRA